MAKRGKVLRDASTGPGLLMVEGQQYQFSLDGVWQSEVPAKPGLVVDVDFDPSGKITAIHAVSESQLAKEQADKAKEKGKEIWGSLVAKVGMPNLVAGALLFISWFWLTAVSVNVPFGGKLEFTFWQVLGYLNASNFMEVMERNGKGSAGIYGLFAIVCLAGPFIHYLWKDKRAVLGGVLPLAFMIIVAIMVRSSISSAMGGSEATGSIGDMQREAQDEILKAISLGIGSYLSVLVSLYFAGVSIKGFLAAKGSEQLSPGKPQKVAA
jgi:hypothetical protein